MSRERRRSNEWRTGTYARVRSRRNRPNPLSQLLQWRIVVPLAAAFLLIGTAMCTQPPKPSVSANDHTPAAIALAATGVPNDGQGNGRTPGSTATAASYPSPAATSSSIRGLAGPVMERVADRGPAPTRKPGTPDPSPSTDHVIVVDGTSGAILYQRNDYEPVAPASLTKIMTAILGIEHGNLADHVKVDVDAHTYSDSTVMGLEPWFDVTLEDILYGLMLPSGNDAAEQIAHYVAGSTDAFVALMNQKAAWLGLKATHFANPHGLDASDHYSNPYDMVVMARYGMQYPVFQKLASAKSYAIRQSNISYVIENLNPILWSYPGADGVKIGYTDNSGRSIVASATRDGHRVFTAFMKCESGLAQDAGLLLDWAFSSFTWPD